MKNSIYEVTKQKTNIKGFWQDNNGKVYVDNIKLYYPKSFPDFQNKINLMFLQKEKCIFTLSKGKAFIIYENDYPVTLTKNIQFKREKLSFNEIKDLLSQYNGITVIKEDNHFIIDIWQA